MPDGFRNLRLLGGGRLAQPRNVEKVILQVIDDLQPQELEVEDAQNHKFWLRITPYRTMDNRIDGAVLAFVEMLGNKRPDEGGK